MLRSEVVVFARWDPFRDLIRIQHGLERLAATAPQGWAPAVDLCETQDAFLFMVELPGLVRDQIRIDVHDNKLTLQGRRDARVSCDHYHQVERGHGEFCRTFLLPHAVIADGVTADLADGVLTITVPKSPTDAPRRVAVT
jgi:HSP20 family protein